MSDDPTDALREQIRALQRADEALDDPPTRALLFWTILGGLAFWLIFWGALWEMGHL